MIDLKHIRIYIYVCTIFYIITKWQVSSLSWIRLKIHKQKFKSIPVLIAKVLRLYLKVEKRLHLKTCHRRQYCMSHSTLAIFYIAALPQFSCLTHFLAIISEKILNLVIEINFFFPVYNDIMIYSDWNQLLFIIYNTNYLQFFMLF